MTRVAAVSRSLLLFAAGACGDTAINTPQRDGGIDGGTISPACLEAVDHSDLEWIQDNIFTLSCARFSACHKGNATSAARLNLEAGRAMMNLVNRPSRVCGEPQTLVIPGDPAASYLMKVLGDYPLPAVGPECPDGDPEEPPETMPYNNPLLCQEKRDAVERWISQLGEPDAGVPADAAVEDSAVPDATPVDAAILDADIDAP